MGQRPRAVEAQEIELLTKARTRRGSHLTPLPEKTPSKKLSRASAPVHPVAAPPVAGKPVSKTGKSSFLSVAAMALVIPGMFATIALPAYALIPGSETTQTTAGAELAKITEAEAQTVVANGAPQVQVQRDAFTATTEAELREQRAAAERAAVAASYRAYSGPSAASYLANPPYPNFSLSQVVAVARQYIGVPYVYGGASPSGFDCSGLVMYVYAQFGVGLAHSVRSQAASGVRISAADAQPGDLVVWSDGSHDGIYSGGGNVIHAPYPGRTVSEQPLWGSYYFVRLGT